MNKSFYFLWMGNSLGKLANSLYMMTVTMMIYHITSSGTLAGLVTMIHVIAKFLSSFFMPIITDRYPLKFILRISLFGQSYLLFILILLFYFKDINHFLINLIIYLIIFFIGFLDGWTNPARNSLTPKIVQKEKLAKANSLISTTDQSLALLGWSLGGVAAIHFGDINILYFALSLYILSALSTLLISEKFRGASKSRPNWNSIKIGWSILFKNANLRLITIMGIIEGIAGGIWIGGITLVFVKEILKQNETWWGYINASYYLGSIIGGIFIVLISKWMQRNLVYSIILGSFGVSVFVLIYAFTKSPIVALTLVFIMGPFYQLRDVSQNTYFQSSIEESYLPKVYSTQSNIYYIVFSISVFLMGTISDFLGVKLVYILASILYFTSSFLAVSINVKRYKDTEIKNIKIKTEG
ncbi:MFS transporter [Anoxybacillus rupiensis]|uniref:MFS transporter n=1 Tax=Anoxybacteroides rupiense TaxID=311460 RepID=A0ABD5IZN2_9BACL|nr:MFS transporter [Anoxybacillus rupiensis]